MQKERRTITLWQVVVHHGLMLRQTSIRTIYRRRDGLETIRVTGRDGKKRTFVLDDPRNIYFTA